MSQTISENTQYPRKASLVVLQDTQSFSMGISFGGSPVVEAPQTFTPNQKIDLSAMHFQFQTLNHDDEGPDSCSIRIFNLARETVDTLLKYKRSRVYLNAGYEGNFGAIFQGEIKQYRVGRLNGTDTYLDILAADGDLAYNNAYIKATLSATQNTRSNQLQAINAAIKQQGAQIDASTIQPSELGGILNGARGKVMWGLARIHLRNDAETYGGTWSIQNGVAQFIPLTGYLPNQAVVLTAATGLIGTPEATQSGVNIRCLLNPFIMIGGRVQIDNAGLNRTVAGIANPGGASNQQFAFNKINAIETFANEGQDGFYRVYVCEHIGDTRGNDWYSELVCLAINTNQVNSP